MTNPQNLVAIVTKLSEKLHRIELVMAKNQQGPDGIIHSITLTLDKLLLAISNGQKVGADIRNGLDKSCAVAIKVFEGSGIDNDLFQIIELLKEYKPQ